MSWYKKYINATGPERGVFDFRNPPAPSSQRGDSTQGSVVAVLHNDGNVYYDRAAEMHGDVVENLQLDSGDILDGGFIIGGKYIMGTSDGGYSAYEGEQVDEVTQMVARVNGEVPINTTAQRKSPDAGKLWELLHNPELQQLTVVRMGIKDMKADPYNGMHSCIARLRVDADKIRPISPELYEMIIGS